MTTTENTLRTFDFSGLELRVIMHMAEPWFVASDVCQSLGMDLKAGTSRWLRGLSPSEILRVTRETEPVLFPKGSKAQSMNLLPESGLYKLIMHSDKPRGPQVPGLGHPRGAAEHPQDGRLPAE
ncbi:BRO-N domain-containing protein [Devosia ginsengisoli]|uniref:BRO-N domain-containing protein n=1 Tax=Devosia ginsengisoli TaxID=400770 RepID=UPI0016452764|nr:BRO family protein [Devosia ginsengisoli]